MRDDRRLPARFRGALLAVARAASLAVALFGLIPGLLLACSGKPPEILGVQWQVILEDSGEGLGEKLMVACAVRDEDGIADLERLHLLCDSADLKWTADKLSWVLNEAGGVTRLGMNDVRMPDGSPLPRGSYRLILVDAAGEKSERALVIAPPATDPRGPLRIARSGTMISLSGPSGQRSLFCYDRSGAVIEVYSFPAPAAASAAPRAIDQASFLTGDLAARVASMRGYCLDPATNLAWLSAPILP